MKRKYVPDLSRQMAQCEANYARMMKLLPDLDVCDYREFQVYWRQHQVVVRLEVEERFTYTSTVVVKQLHEGGSSWLSTPTLVVRLYHDATMAEVICLKSRRQLSGVYGYPNRNMHHPDEKAQLNDYLGEWLNHCLNHGHHNEPVFV
jgi:hypothetical protein